MLTVSPMTDAEAEAMLAELTKHYRQPVMPVERYCAALQAWATALEDRAERSKEKHDEQQAQDVRHVFMSIRKSCLLDRLIYGGEKLRTEMCPVHQGKWSGCRWDDESFACGCGFGSNVTGWLKPKAATDGE